MSKLILEKKITEFLFWKSNKTHEKTNVAIESKKNESLNLLNPETRKLIAFSLWCHQESNRGHKDFQSFALP
ncbi:MAG: hypothetical protein UH543_08020, partial [Bacteroidales bacterium]|nr:hypothetical protein [Bacteroidales bacterium]